MDNSRKKSSLITDDALVKTARELLTYAADMASKTDLITSDLLLTAVWCCLNCNPMSDGLKDIKPVQHSDNVASNHEDAKATKVHTSNQVEVKETVNRKPSVSQQGFIKGEASISDNCEKEDENKAAEKGAQSDDKDHTPKALDISKDECDNGSISETDNAKVKCGKKIENDSPKKKKNSELNQSMNKNELMDELNGDSSKDSKNIVGKTLSDISNKTEKSSLGGANVVDKLGEKCKEKTEMNNSKNEINVIILDCEDDDNGEGVGKDDSVEKDKTQNNKCKTIIQRETKVTETEVDNHDYFDMDCDEIDEEEQFEEMFDTADSVGKNANISHDLKSASGTSGSEKNNSETTDVIMIISDDEDELAQDLNKKTKPQISIKGDEGQSSSKNSPGQNSKIKKKEETYKGNIVNEVIEKVFDVDSSKDKVKADTRQEKGNCTSIVIDLDSDDETETDSKPPTKPTDGPTLVSDSEVSTDNSGVQQSADPVDKTSEKPSEADDRKLEDETYASNFSCQVIDAMDSMSNNNQTKNDTVNDTVQNEDSVRDIMQENNALAVPVTLLGLIPKCDLKKSPIKKVPDPNEMTPQSGLPTQQGLYVSSMMPYMTSSSVPGSSMADVQSISNSIMASYAQGLPSMPGQQIPGTVDGLYNSTNPQMAANQQAVYIANTVTDVHPGQIYLASSSIGADPHLAAYVPSEDHGATGMSSLSMGSKDGSPPFKKRLLDFDKKWHKGPKFHQNPDRYLALPGGIEGNTVYSIEDRHRKMSAARQVMWQTTNNYTNVQENFPVPSIGIESVDGNVNINDFYMAPSQNSSHYNMNLDTSADYLSESDEESGNGKTRGRGRGRGVSVVKRVKNSRSRSRGVSTRGSRSIRRARQRGRGRGRVSGSTVYGTKRRGRPPLVRGVRGRPKSVGSILGSVRDVESVSSNRGRGLSRGRGARGGPGRKIGFFKVKSVIGRGRGRGRGRGASRGEGTGSYFAVADRSVSRGSDKVVGGRVTRATRKQKEKKKRGGGRGKSKERE